MAHLNSQMVTKSLLHLAVKNWRTHHSKSSLELPDPFDRHLNYHHYHHQYSSPGYAQLQAEHVLKTGELVWTGIAAGDKEVEAAEEIEAAEEVEAATAVGVQEVADQLGIAAAAAAHCHEYCLTH